MFYKINMIKWKLQTSHWDQKNKHPETYNQIYFLASIYIKKTFSVMFKQIRFLIDPYPSAEVLFRNRRLYFMFLFFKSDDKKQ